MQGRRLFLLFFRLFTELLAGFTTWYKDVSPPSFFLFSRIVSRIHNGGIEMSITSFSFFFQDYRQRWRSLWYDRMMPIISFYLSLFFANADKVHDVVSVIRYRFAFFSLFSGIVSRVHDGDVDYFFVQVPVSSFFRDYWQSSRCGCTSVDFFSFPFFFFNVASKVHDAV